jgi:TRAP-type C4-dicarboxylate transport system permease small subunit
MLASFVRAMDGLHRLCIVISGICLVVITLIIPWGVFTRYVLDHALSWPEPMAVLLMIWFSFLAAASCYRERLHIAVGYLPSILTGWPKLALGIAIELAMASISLFMLLWGVRLVEATYHQVIAEFPIVSVGISYLPVPLGGAITLLFVIERLWTGRLFGEAEPDAAAVAVE